MRAAVITRFDAGWEIRDIPDPTPGPGQVLIQVVACGFCGTDLHVHRGHLGGTLPLVAGHEPVGKIIELGAGVIDFKIGDRVGVCWNQKGCGRCRPCREQRYQFCIEGCQTWQHVGGGFAERVLAWAQGCVLIPDGVPDELAAPMMCAGYTVLSSLRAGDPRPGERVAILGVGGLGHLALQMAKALGLETVAVTGTASKAGELTALGADTVLVAADHPGEALRAAGGADIVVSTTNSAAHVRSVLGGLRAGGRLVNCGNLDGALEVASSVLNYQQLRVVGGTQLDRKDIVDALELTASKRITPRVEVYPLGRIDEVRERLAAGNVRYRAVLTVASR
jgi:D-arabinose 1-dehydrogenase-like Zn-dependent alcohol dehydrogenase